MKKMIALGLFSAAGLATLSAPLSAMPVKHKMPYHKSRKCMSQGCGDKKMMHARYDFGRYHAFAGISYGQTWLRQKYNIEYNYSYKYNGIDYNYINVAGNTLTARAPIQGVQLGAYIMPHLRASLNYRYMDEIDSEYDLHHHFMNHIFLGSVDYVFTPFKEAMALKPFVGASLGWVRSNYELREYLSKKFESKKSNYAMGLQAGVSWQVTQRMDLDVTYRYLSFKTKHKFTQLQSDGDDFYHFQLHHLNGVALSINYLM